MNKGQFLIVVNCTTDHSKLNSIISKCLQIVGNEFTISINHTDTNVLTMKNCVIDWTNHSMTIDTELLNSNTIQFKGKINNDK